MGAQSRNVRPGQKTRKQGSGTFATFRVHGGCEPVCPVAPMSRIPKGSYYRVGRLVLDESIPWQRIPKEQHELTSGANKLFKDFLLRRAFWQACQDGVPVDRAGKIFLGGVAKSRAHKVFQEIQPNPLLWFQRKFLVFLTAGKVHGGLATSRSKEADAFFTCLAGGTEHIRWIARKLSGQRLVIVSDLFRAYGIGTLDKEAILYSVHAGLLQANLLEEPERAG